MDKSVRACVFLLFYEGLWIFVCCEKRGKCRGGCVYLWSWLSLPMISCRKKEAVPDRREFICITVHLMYPVNTERGVVKSRIHIFLVLWVISAWLPLYRVKEWTWNITKCIGVSGSKVTSDCTSTLDIHVHDEEQGETLSGWYSNVVFLLNPSHE